MPDFYKSLKTIFGHFEINFVVSTLYFFVSCYGGF